jgi:sortase A
MNRRRRPTVIVGLLLVACAAIAVPLALVACSSSEPSATAAVGSGPTDQPSSVFSTGIPLVSPTTTGSAPATDGRTSSPTESISGTGVAGATAAPATPPTPGIIADHIAIKRLGIDLPVIEGDGIDAPLGKAVHYPGTAWPGGGSNIYLYGHAREHAFIALWDVRVGDEIVVHLIDGTERVYEVSEIRPRVAWNDMSVIAPTPTEQLSLQTCTSYENTAPRFLVIAVPRT